ncbi:MAG: hypothetical protein K1X28_08275 [Parachlamydiales bacterium]|nr:hypothetical protein [Parachlamydiales bacterium]
MANPLLVQGSMTRSAFTAALTEAYKDLNEHEGPAFVIQNMNTAIQEAGLRAKFMSLGTDTSTVYSQDDLQQISNQIFAKWQAAQRDVQVISADKPARGGVCLKVSAVAAAVVATVVGYLYTQR